MLEDKPVLDFYALYRLLGFEFFGFHTPFALSRKARVNFGELDDMDSKESLLFYRIYLPFLAEQVKKRRAVRPRDVKSYHDKRVNESIPDEYLFDITKSKAYFVFSEEPPVPESLPDELRTILWPSSHPGKNNP